MIARRLTRFASTNFMKTPMRAFGAMDQIDRSLFEYKFTGDMEFKSSFDKIKCFRVIDEEGVVVTPGYADKIPKDELLKIYDSMVTINEADQVYNAAQRQSRISFYMT
jgi:2-oxoisovalerate dehydrogenase E1 component alpha subunit